MILKKQQRGEWWISDGRATFADAEVGDYNHSGIVIEHILSQHDLSENTDLTKESQQSLKNYGLSDEEIDVVLDRKDPREYAMKHWGWKRIQGNNVQTQYLLDEDLKDIANGLFDAYEQDIESGGRKFNIEVVSNRTIYEDVPWYVIEQEDASKIFPYRFKYAKFVSWYKKAQEDRDKLFIHYPDGLHTWGICLQSIDQEKLQKFIFFCRAYINEKLGAFWQSGNRKVGDKYAEFQFFEFLGSKDENLILKECEKVAHHLEMDLA